MQEKFKINLTTSIKTCRNDMRNGHYLIRHDLLGTEYTLKVNKGVHSLYLGDIYLNNISAEAVKKFYTILKTISREYVKYDIAWWMEGKVKEVIKVDASYCICIWKIAELRRTTHRHGLLRPIKKP